MKYLVSILAAALLTAVCCNIGTAQTASEDNQPWHLVFASDLAKIADPQKTDGLGYTLTEEESLDQAIKKAIIDNKAPACQVAKLAVGMNILCFPAFLNAVGRLEWMSCACVQLRSVTLIHYSGSLILMISLLTKR